MNPNVELLARYSPGGDIYQSLSASYGKAGADRVFETYKAGGEVSKVIGQLKHGEDLNDSTASVFTKQVTSDPLGAPFAAANRQLAKVGLNFLKNPLVALVIFGGLAIYFWPALRPVVARFTK